MIWHISPACQRKILIKMSVKQTGCVALSDSLSSTKLAAPESPDSYQVALWVMHIPGFDQMNVRNLFISTTVYCE